ncbi:MAG: hypothetical protein JEZ05_00765 [Tenericutes bacterium]|nr:hypothetical protein [Mycoplasmatota bacterium]
MSKESIIVNFFEEIRIKHDPSNFGNIKVRNSYHNKMESKWSKCFSNRECEYNHSTKDVLHIISSVFDNEIETNNRYKESFGSAITAQGNEYKRITRFHSSSLCSYLHFYKVSAENPLSINMNGTIFKFTKVFFEVKNYCLGKSTASMDVVLVSPESNSILFLESKFGEYLNSGSTYVSKEYEEKYLKYFGDCNSQISENIVIKKAMVKSVEKIKLEKKDRYKLYTGGIKQMISHFISIDNFLKRNVFEETKERLSKYLNEDSGIYLGEILFDFGQFSTADRSLENYRNEYKSLVKILEHHNKDIHFLSKILTYQEDLIFCEPLSKTIKEFYKY